MTSMTTKPSPAEIRRARADNPKARERDVAKQLGISEADLVAASCGAGVRRIRADVDAFLTGAPALGEVMALTRNESAVHEKIGTYEKPVLGKHASMVLGSQIDLRIFPRDWVHGFAVEKGEGAEMRRSLQFFDAAGEAVHKLHLREASNVDAYEALVASMLTDDQSDAVAVAAKPLKIADNDDAARPHADDLRERWARMTDVHQFVGILRDLKLSRRQAVELVGPEFAWRIDDEAVPAVMRLAADEALPIMCFVGNGGCIQIHSGPIAEIKPMGPWINVLDPTFHLHLRTDHITDVWAVRKPNVDGHVSSIEAYGADGSMIIQFFGQRKEGTDERREWRGIVEGLPRVPQSSAA
nr:ChuX/HutX family heme-like substrate-binding protein [Aquibium microcysteis]